MQEFPSLIASIEIIIYYEVGQAQNVKTNIEMLLAINEYKNYHLSTNVDPHAVGSIAKSEMVLTYKELLATKACDDRMMF